MAVKYLSGNRLWGTNAERLAMSTSLSTFSTTSEPADAGRGIQQGGIRQEIAGYADATRGVFSGGNVSGVINVIQYITIQSTGNTSDFGDITVARRMPSGLAA
jgi:hypothetical protein